MVLPDRESAARHAMRGAVRSMHDVTSLLLCSPSLPIAMCFKGNVLENNVELFALGGVWCIKTSLKHDHDL